MATRTEVFKAKFDIKFENLETLEASLKAIDIAAKNSVESLSALSKLNVVFKTATSSAEKFADTIERTTNIKVGKAGGIEGTAADVRKLAQAMGEFYGKASSQGELEANLNAAAVAIGSTVKSVNAALKRVKTDNSDPFDFLVDSAKNAYTEVVGSSWIPDLATESAKFLVGIAQDAAKGDPFKFISTSSEKAALATIGSMDKMDQVVNETKTTIRLVSLAISDMASEAADTGKIMVEGPKQSLVELKEELGQASVAGAKTFDILRQDAVAWSNVLGNEVKSVVVPALDRAKNGAVGLGEDFSAAFRDMRRDIGAVGAELQASLTPKVSAIATRLSTVGEGIQYAFQKVSASVKSTSATIDRELRGKATVAMQSLVKNLNLAKSDFDVVGGRLSRVFAPIAIDAKQAAASVQSSMSGLVTTTSRQATQIGSKLSGVFDGWSQGTVAATKTAGAAVSSFARDSKDKIDAFTGSLSSEIIFDFADTAVGKFTEVGTSLKNLLKGTRKSIDFISTSTEEADTAVLNLASSILKLDEQSNQLRVTTSRGIGPLIDADQFRAIEASAESAFRGVLDKSDATIIELRKAFRSYSAQARAELKETGLVNEQTWKSIEEVSLAATQRSGQQYKARADNIQRHNDAIRESSIQTSISVSKRFGSLAQAITTPGLRLQGLREALDGTNVSSNALVRGLDKLISRNSGLDNSTNKLTKQMISLAQAADKELDGLRKRAQEVRDNIQLSKENADEFNTVDNAIRRADNAFKTFTKTAKRGGDVSGALISIQEEVDDLLVSYENLSPEVKAQTLGIIEDFKRQEVAARGMAVRHQALQKEVEETAEKQKELADTAAKLGKTTKQLEREQSLLGRTIAGLGSSFGRVTSSIGTMSSSIASALNPFRKWKSETDSVNDSLRKTDTQVNVVVKGITGLQAAVTGLVGGLAGVAVGGIIGPWVGEVTQGIGSIVTFGQEVGGQSKQIAAAIGGQRDQLSNLNAVIKDVYVNNFGTSLDDIGEQLQQVTLRLGRFGTVSDEVLSTATQHVFRLRDAYPDLGDTNEITDAVALLIESFEDIETVDDAFDFIAAGAQRGLNSSRDFIDTIREYSTQFDSAGATGEQFFNLLDTGLQGGVLGTDKAIDLFKEFRVRILDGSAATKKGLTQIGVDYASFTKDLAAGNITTADAFQIITDKLRGVNDQGVLMQAGVALLGTQFEDLGINATKDLSLVGTTMDDIRGSTLSLDLQYDTFSAKVSTLKRNIISSFDTTPVFTFLTAIVSAVTPLATFGASLLSSVLTPLNSIAEGITNIPATLAEMATAGEGVLSDFAAAASGALSGNWDAAWGGVLATVDSAIAYISGSLNDLIDNGFTYGYNYVVQIADGIIDAVSSVIVSAMNFLGETIASFTRTASPPKEGPLSDIDDWGKGLIEVYGEGMKDADFGFLIDVLDPIADVLKGKGMQDQFRVIQASVADAISEINATGNFDAVKLESAFALLPEGEAKLVGAQAKEIIDARQKVVAAQKKIDDALDKGEFNKAAAAQADLDAAIAAEKALGEQIKLQDKLNKLDEQVAGVDKAKAAAAPLDAVAAAAGAAEKAASALQKTNKETYDEKVAQLDSQLAAGIITEEQYLSGVISANKTWFDSEENTAKNITAAKVREYQAQLDALEEAQKEAGKAGSDLAIASFSPTSLLPGKKDIELVVREVAENVGTTFNEGISSRLSELPAIISSKLKAAFAPIGVQLKELFIKKLQEFKDYASKPENFGIAAIGVGLVAGLIGIPLIAILSGIGTVLVAVLGPALALLGGLVPLLIEAAAVGGLIVGTWTQWDLLVETLGPSITQFTDNIKKAKDWALEFWDAFSNNERLQYLLSYWPNLAGQIATTFVLVISLFKGPIEQIVLLVTTLGNALATAFLGSGSSISPADAANFLVGVLDTLTTYVWQANAAVQGAVLFLTGLQIAAAKAIPEYLPVLIQNITEGLTAFFSEGRLGAEVLGLLSDVWGLISETLFNPNLWIAIGAVIGVVIGLIANIIVALFQTLYDNRATIEAFATGIVVALRGVVQFVTGIVQVVQGVLGGIVALFTGDFEGARALVVEGLNNMVGGIYTTLSGLILAISAAIQGVFSIVIGFVTNFVANIFEVMGYKNIADGIRGFGQAFAEIGGEIFSKVQTVVTQLQTIFSTGIDGVIALFWGLYDEIVGNSIIPDMVTEVVRWITEVMPSLISNWFNGGGLATLISSFVTMGVSLVTGFISGITDNLPSLGELFGGSEDSGMLSFISTVFGGGDQSAQLGATQTMVSTITTTWNTFVLTAGITWETFVLQVQTGMMTITSSLTVDAAVWIETWTLFSTTAISWLDIIIERVVKLGTDGTSATDSIKSGVGSVADSIIDRMLPAIGRAIKLFERLAVVAKNATDAARGAGAASGTPPLASYATGTMRVPRTGNYTLHKDEAVLNAEAAGTLRTLLRSIGNVNARSLNLPTGAVQGDSKTVNYNVNVNASYANQQSQASIFDDVSLALRLVGNGV